MQRQIRATDKSGREGLPDDAKARVEGLICHWRGGKAMFFFGYFNRGGAQMHGAEPPRGLLAKLREVLRAVHG